MKFNLLFTLQCLLVSLMTSQAQENRWTSTGGGKWEDGSKWLLGIPPNLNHDVAIANGASRPPAFGSVVVDATSATLPNNMVVSTLRVGSGAQLVLGEDVLTLLNAGFTTPLTVLSSLTISNHGHVNITGSILNVNDGLTMSGGELTLQTGAIVNVKGNNSPAYDFGVNGVVKMNDGLLNFSNNVASAMGIGGAGVGTLTMSGGTWQIGGSAYLHVGGQPGSSGSLIMTGGVARLEGQFISVAALSNSTGSVLLAGGQLVTGDVRIGFGGAGQMVVSNGTWRTKESSNVRLGFNNGSNGKLLVAGGTSILSGTLEVGWAGNTNASGSLLITGGEFVTTNASTSIPNIAVISNGLWRARDISVFQAIGSAASGRLVVAGGSTRVATDLLIGEQFSCSLTGQVAVTGGDLIITNAATNATLAVYTGTFRLEGGTVIADRIDLTSPCSRFERTGGTLLYRTALLDPLRDDDNDGVPNGLEQSKGFDPLDPADARRDSDGDGATDGLELLSGSDPFNADSIVKIISLLRQGDDMRVRWKTVAGRTNIVQAAETLGQASNFVDLAPLAIAGSGDRTNTFIEPDGAIISPSRFYRIRVVP